MYTKVAQTDRIKYAPAENGSLRTCGRRWRPETPETTSRPAGPGRPSRPHPPTSAPPPPVRLAASGVGPAQLRQTIATAAAPLAAAGGGAKGRAIDRFAHYGVRAENFVHAAAVARALGCVAAHATRRARRAPLVDRGPGFCFMSARGGARGGCAIGRRARLRGASGVHVDHTCAARGPCAPGHNRKARRRKSLKIQLWIRRRGFVVLT